MIVEYQKEILGMTANLVYDVIVGETTQGGFAFQVYQQNFAPSGFERWVLKLKSNKTFETSEQAESAVLQRLNPEFKQAYLETKGGQIESDNACS